MPRTKRFKSRRGKRVKHRKGTKKYRRHNKSSKSHKKYRRMRGGYGQGAGPVGYGWKSDPLTWPGVAASKGADTNGMSVSNHYPYNSNGIGVGSNNLAIPTRGGLADLYQTGGGIGISDIPIIGDFLKAGQQATFFTEKGASAAVGAANTPVNPSPVDNVALSEDVKLLTGTHQDIGKIVQQATTEAAKY